VTTVQLVKQEVCQPRYEGITYIKRYFISNCNWENYYLRYHYKNFECMLERLLQLL